MSSLDETIKDSINHQVRLIKTIFQNNFGNHATESLAEKAENLDDEHIRYLQNYLILLACSHLEVVVKESYIHWVMKDSSTAVNQILQKKIFMKGSNPSNDYLQEMLNYISESLKEKFQTFMKTDCKVTVKDDAVNKYHEYLHWVIKSRNEISHSSSVHTEAASAIKYSVAAILISIKFLHLMHDEHEGKENDFSDYCKQYLPDIFCYNTSGKTHELKLFFNM